MKILAVIFITTIVCTCNISKSQSLLYFADSVINEYKIPELAYAVVSSDSILELQTLGVQRINTNYLAKQNDRFHIGSNTKAITSFIAALLVKDERLRWNTKFFDLFPDLKKNSRKVYYNITLQDLLTFRGKLPPYTYTNEHPAQKEIIGDNAHQRYLLAKYFLSQKSMKEDENGLTRSNADYILAGLMLEKASGKSYKELVLDFGKSVNIEFGFDYPNLTDTFQPWGHDASLKPVPPFNNYKLNWLLSAGNINVSLPDYIKFVQLQLKGLKGISTMLANTTYNKLIYGMPSFSFGWFNSVDSATQHHVAENIGNAGAFITRVQIIKESDKGYIIFTNSYTEETSKGIDVLLEALKDRYGR